MITPKRFTHRPTGMQISIEKSLEGKQRLYVDLQGNSITSTAIDKKSMESFFNFLNKVVDEIDVILYDLEKK
jgi:hypothetical protein